MRDLEFSQEFDRLSLRLEMYFRKLLRNSPVNGDRAVLAQDLVQLTAIEAWKNSQKPQYAETSIEKLLFYKADNIWNSYCNPPKKSLGMAPLELIEESATAEPNGLQQLIMAEDLAKLKAISEEKAWKTFELRIKEGYSYDELALPFHETKENLRQLHSRLKKKIRNTWKSRGDL